MYAARFLGRQEQHVNVLLDKTSNRSAGIAMHGNGFPAVSTTEQTFQPVSAGVSRLRSNIIEDFINGRNLWLKFNCQSKHPLMLAAALCLRTFGAAGSSVGARCHHEVCNVQEELCRISA